MGDHRDNSSDSRILSAVGYVPFQNLVGRAELIFWSMEDVGPLGVLELAECGALVTTVYPHPVGIQKCAAAAAEDRKRRREAS
jgi:signal peptidase S26 family